MKLYDSTMAPNARRVRIFLAEKGIEVPLAPIDIMAGEHKGAEYRKIAPNSRVPALELDDGTVILETMAICRYFEGLQPDPPLMGVDTLDAAIVEMWQRRMELELFLPMGMAFRHTHPVMSALEEQVPEFGEKQRTIANQRLSLLDEELAGKEFIAGDRYTVADITALTAIDFFKLAGFEIKDDQKHLAAWHQAVSSRPSAAA